MKMLHTDHPPRHDGAWLNPVGYSNWLAQVSTTEYRRENEQLKQNAAELQKTVDALCDAVIAADADALRYKRANDLASLVIWLLVGGYLWIIGIALIKWAL